MTAELDDSAWVRAMPLVFVLIWSTGFIVAKYGLPHAPPLGFLAWRYFFSIVCFLIWIAVAGAKWPDDPRQWWHLAVTGALMHAGYLGGVWVAVELGMGSGLAALVVGLQPVLTAIWVSRIEGGQVTRMQWLGLLLGFGGLILVIWRKLMAGTEVSTFTLAGTVFALLAITAGTLYQKRFLRATDVRTANAIQLSAALIITLPLTFLESEPMVWNVSLMGAMAWAVGVLTLGGSSLLYLLIQRGAATSVASLMYLVPPTTAIMAWFLFDELITAVTLIGTALTAIGVALVVRQPKPKPAASS
jgi:drug/metabolite transporter (DMT)-like permease